MPKSQATSDKPLIAKKSIGARHGRRANKDSKEHALGVGDDVAVFSIGAGGPSIEGTGIIEFRAPAQNYYWIKFENERVLRLRFINPDWQAAPDHSLALLVEFWRTSRSDNPTIEDFFPDD